MTEKMDVKEMNLFVVGGSSDLGMALIRSCYPRYAHIIAHYRRMNDQFGALCAELGERLIPIQADLSDRDEVLDLIGKVKETGIAPTHIVHFPAPQCTNQKFHRIAWDVMQNEIDISVRSLVLLLKEFLPTMAKQRYGKLVILLSFVVNGMPPKYCSNYVVTKYALLGLMKALAVEYADKGITVNGVSPAWVRTKYINNMHDILIEKNAQESPIGRILVPDDVIPAIEFLLSEKADCINGQNLSVTCGL